MSTQNRGMGIGSLRMGGELLVEPEFFVYPDLCSRGDP